MVQKYEMDWDKIQTIARKVQDILLNVETSSTAEFPPSPMSSEDFDLIILYV